MADKIQFRRDTKSNWELYNPILAEGEIGFVTDDPNLYKIGDGESTWNQLPFRGFDGTIVHETGDSQTAAMSQQGVQSVYRTFLADRSIIGTPNIDGNHIYSISGDGTNNRYVASDEFDTGWVLVSDDSGIMSVTGATITRVIFFNALEPLMANEIDRNNTSGFDSISIPSGSKLALITLRKTDNPNGYGSLRAIQPGAAAKKVDLENTKTDFNGKITLLKERLYKNRSFSGKVDIDENMLPNIMDGTVNYQSNEDFDTAFIDIFDESTYLEITGAVITRLIFYSGYEVKTENYITSYTNYVQKIPEEAVMATITLRKTDNEAGYADLRVKQLGAAPSSLQLLRNTGELFTEKSFYVSRLGKEITTADYLTSTGYLPISGKDDLVVKGANNASVPCITFFDSHFKFISAIEQTEQNDARTYKVAASDIPIGAKYIRCVRNENADSEDSYVIGVNIAALLAMHDSITPEFKQVITGKNLINPSDLLRGITYSSDSGLITSTNGIMSNKLRLTPGTYTIQGLAPYSGNQTIVRILRFNDKDEMLYADKVSIDGNKIGHYTVTAGDAGVGGNAYVDYWRIVLQFNTNALYDPNAVQFEKNNEATEFEPCKTKLIENPSYRRTPRMAFMTGASSTMPGNGYFETACEMLGFKHRNVAISGESVMQHATKAWRGLIYQSDGRMTDNVDDEGNFLGLYTFEELENTDIFVTSHIHNYNVGFQGHEYEKVGSFKGAFNSSGGKHFIENFAVDIYAISKSDEGKTLKVSTYGYESSLPYFGFFDINGQILSSETYAFTSSGEPLINHEIAVPANCAFIWVKKYDGIGFETKLIGSTTILCDTVEDYESKGYDSSNNPLEAPMDKTDKTQRIVPYGGGGAPGPKIPNETYDERYAAGYDYLLKKYALDCYNLRLNPDSKWYGTKSGKPVIIVCTTQWHDGYVRFNEGIKKVARRHGAILCDVANNVGFSYMQTNPEDESSIRWNALHCNNTSIGSGNDVEDIPIHGIIYSDMGWHPTRDWSCYIQMKRAQILAAYLKFATYNDGYFGQMV